MRNAIKEYRETSSEALKVGDIVTCPSDRTGIKWRVVAVDSRGALAKTVEGQEHPKDYPYTINIVPEAFDQWKKVV